MTARDVTRCSFRRGQIHGHKMWPLQNKIGSGVLSPFSQRDWQCLPPCKCLTVAAQEVPPTAAACGVGWLWKEFQHATSWKSSRGRHFFLTITAAEWRGQLSCWALTAFASLSSNSDVFDSPSCLGDCEAAAPRTSPTHYYSASNTSMSSELQRRTRRKKSSVYCTGGKHNLKLRLLRGVQTDARYLRLHEGK